MVCGQLLSCLAVTTQTAPLQAQSAHIQPLLPAQPNAAVEELEYDAGPVLHAAGGQQDIQWTLPHHTRHAAILRQERAGGMGAPLQAHGMCVLGQHAIDGGV